MKRIPSIILSLVFIASLFGCASGEIPTGNSLFTNVFFADVVEIRDSRCGQAQGDQMEPVIDYLKMLTLTATEEHLKATNENGEQLYGLDVITFVKSDGTEISFLRNHATLTGSGDRSYVTDGENLNEGLKEAFNQK